MELYYYNRFDKTEKAVYQAMFLGMDALKDVIAVPRLDIHDLSNIFFFMRLDHPELFWVSGFQCRSYADSAQVQILPEYLFDKGKIEEQKRAMKARVEKLARAAAELDPWAQEKYIHDFICENITYDKLKKAYSHEIIGPLGHGVGVCEGIAKSVKVLCDRLGIWCMIAISEANPEKNIRYRHAWNIVKIGGKTYHLDCTFDNSISRNAVRYDYFNLNDARIFRDHEPVIGEVPACSDGSHFYYMEKKLSFTKMEDLEKRVQQAVKKNRMLIFQWRGGYLTKEVMQELLQMIHRCAREKEKFARVSLNYTQAVFQVEIVKEVYEETVTMEETYDKDEAADEVLR